MNAEMVINIPECMEKPSVHFYPSPNAVYLCCRGTKQKQGLIAGQFNISDTNITHIGIGFTGRNGFQIYHVSDTKKNGLYFHIESIDDFISEKGTRYFGAWIIDAKPENLEAIKSECLKKENEQFIFDPHFSLTNGDTLYCSEFCRNVLMNSGLNCLFPTRKISLPGNFYKSYFGADSLEYVPVDFFLGCNSLTKTYESPVPEN